ncbi:MAG TPA: FkbM family methyltransferase, partial [Puia sp.]|nr:FkbM family methyltransferase [Puia sp.]
KPNTVRKSVEKILLPKSKVIYSQAGEDLILDNLFYRLDITRPDYLDIGTNDPRYFNNTYYFYLKGSSGVCVEPNPYLYQKIKKLRSRDICINAGIGMESATAADFYLFPDHASGLSTFSRENAEHWQKVGMYKMGKINYEKIISMPLIPINDLIEKYCKKTPDLLSIDVEGLDFSILQSLDFGKYSPRAICVETLAYAEDQKEYKTTNVIDFLKMKGYAVYADTHINTIFIRE